jgi:HEAT repeat protein
MMQKVMAALEPSVADADALVWLASLGDAVVPTLLQIVQRSRQRSKRRPMQVVEHAIMLLGELRPKEAIATLVDYLLTGTLTPSLQWGLEATLKQYGEAMAPTALEVLRQDARAAADGPGQGSCFNEGRDAVFQVLVDLRKPIPGLLEAMLADLRREPRAAVAYLVGAYGDPAAIPFFRESILGFDGFDPVETHYVPAACLAIEQLGGELTLKERRIMTETLRHNENTAHHDTRRRLLKPGELSMDELLEVLDKNNPYDEEWNWMLAQPQVMAPLLLELLERLATGRLRGHFQAANHAIELAQKLNVRPTIAPMVASLLTVDVGGTCMAALEESLRAWGPAMVPIALAQLEESLPHRPLGRAVLLDVLVSAKVQDPRLFRLLIGHLRENPGSHAAALLGRYGDRGALPFLELAVAMWEPGDATPDIRVIPAACQAIEALGGSLGPEARVKAQLAQQSMPVAVPMVHERMHVYLRAVTVSSL